MAFEIEDVEDGALTIEWDVPLPPPPITFNAGRKLKPGEFVWTKRLSSFRKWPGREARIKDGLKSSSKATAFRMNVLASLARSDKMEKWTLRTAKQDNGTWGVWCTYDGRYTEVEYLERQKLRQERGEVIKARKLASQARRAESLLPVRPIHSLRPPVWKAQ